MKKNTTLGSYDFRYNGIYDESNYSFIIKRCQGVSYGCRLRQACI